MLEKRVDDMLNHETSLKRPSFGTPFVPEKPPRRARNIGPPSLLFRGSNLCGVRTGKPNYANADISKSRSISFAVCESTAVAGQHLFVDFLHSVILFSIMSIISQTKHYILHPNYVL